MVEGWKAEPNMSARLGFRVERSLRALAWRCAECGREVDAATAAESLKLCADASLWSLRCEAWHHPGCPALSQERVAEAAGQLQLLSGGEAAPWT